MYLNFIRILFFAIFLHNIYSQDQLKCQRGLLSTYGIPSLEYPEPLEIYMCPNIKNSCCPLTAQKNIFNNWVVQEEGGRLKTQFDNYLEIYRHFLDNLDSVHEQAENLLTKLQDIKYSNCKVMADKIVQFKVEIVATKLKQTLNEMYEFFRNSYKGFYCTLCDFDQQQYIDVLNSVINLNQQFCRDILVHSLPSLLYFHSDFAPFMNLAVRFLTNCDSKGTYTKNIINKSFFFTVDFETQDRIKKCKNFVSSEKWFLYCQPVCQQFHPGYFSDFFHPHLQKIETFSKFVTKRLLDLKQLEVQPVPPTNQQQARILSQKVPKTTQTVQVTDQQVIDTIEDFRDIKQEQEVFQPTLNGEVDINDFDVEFEIEGINFYEIGKAAILDETMLRKAIETQSQNIGLPKQEQAPQPETAKPNEVPPPTQNKNEPARLLMSSNILKQVLVIFLVLLSQQNQLIQNSTISNSINSIYKFFYINLQRFSLSNFFIFINNNEFFKINFTYQSIQSFYSQLKYSNCFKSFHILVPYIIDYLISLSYQFQSSYKNSVNQDQCSSQLNDLTPQVKGSNYLQNILLYQSPYLFFMIPLSINKAIIQDKPLQYQTLISVIVYSKNNFYYIQLIGTFSVIFSPEFISLKNA